MTEERPRLFHHINDVTGFANGTLWDSAADLRRYFTIETLHQMVGRQPFLTPEGEDMTPSQSTLNAWAAIVIRHRWHCTKDFSAEDHT